MMDDPKRLLLEQTYAKFLEIGFGIGQTDTLDEISDPQIMGFGTTADEVIASLSGLRELIARQKEQSKGIDIAWIPTPIRHYLSSDGDTAVFADDIKLHIGAANEKIEIQLRFSIVLVFEQGKWLVLHFHGSKPENVSSETDTFGIDEWKQRTVDLEKQVAARTLELTEQKEALEQTLRELKSTQSQLIQSEKMASLGELTAGIAHEIQNPLNFVNNFSELSIELLDEMETEITKGDLEEAKAISLDIKQNLEKIALHGKRADGIVKGMLQHSRNNSGTKEPTDLNALCDEYLRLSYHGLRAKDKSFNATLQTDFDPSVGKINLIPQDIGRVVLNLLTNAFYAVNEKKQSGVAGYEPTVSIATKKTAHQVVIQVGDNGNGIPQHAIDKIFQPFFTTKPTGQGTGLGLSLAYDIITKGHGGDLKVETTPESRTLFTIQLPIKP